MKKMPQDIPPQEQDQQPGVESEMRPQPVYDDGRKGFGRLKGKTAIITGGDSGIGRSVAIWYAKEGADVVIVYLNEHDDANETAKLVNAYGKEAHLIATDISEENNCKSVVEQTIQKFGSLDIVVNNSAVQFPKESLEEISLDQLQHTFAVNIFSYFHLSKHALPYLKQGSTIINTTSVNAYRGNPKLIDYSSTKGAVVSFTRSLSLQLVKKGIRVNAVAPGPVWTPLIPSTFSPEEVAEFGKDSPMGRPAQPIEIAGCYVFLACDESAFITGQVLHPNGGSIINT